MKKQLVSLWAILLLLFSSANAQKGCQREGFDISNYPEVTFVWHEYNPSVLTSDYFKLQENDNSVAASVTNMSPPSLENQPKRIVVLWEDMGVNGEKNFRQSQNVLTQFLASVTFGEQDAVYIAAFNRQSGSSAVLKDVVSGFTSDRTQLQQAVEGYRHSEKRYAELPNQSDVFPAIHDALNLLQKEDDKAVKAVFVITAGRALESSATNTDVAIKALALEYHIPIYIVQHTQIHGKSVKMEDLATGTFGQYVLLGDEMHNGAAALTGFYNELAQRYAGQDYRITFNTNTPRGSKNSAVLNLSVNNYTYHLTMPTPKHSFDSWVKSHVTLFVILLVGLLLIITACILYVVINKKRHKADAARMSDILHQQDIAKQKVIQQEKELQDMQRDKEQQQEAQQKAEQQKLNELMYTKGLFPTIRYTDTTGKPVIFQMNKPTIIIGRQSGCDITLNNNTISRTHCSIKFTGKNFEIIDLKSTNGTFVGGIPATSPIILKDQDVINIGQLLLTFNI